MLEELKKIVCEANMDLPKYGLVNFTWGNVSAIDRASGLFIIKPSGVKYGTTHADYIYGEVPCLRCLTAEEIAEGYEKNTGRLIVSEFLRMCKDPLSVPAVLCKNHGPFVWGKDAEEALHNAVVLEEVAKMAYHSEDINHHIQPAPQELQDKHYYRKHGANAYYGQN